MANNTAKNATAVGPIKPPIPIYSIPGLIVSGLAEKLLSIGKLANHGFTSVFGKDKVEFYQTPPTINGVKLGEGLKINKKYLVHPLTASPAPKSPASLLT